MNAMTPDIARAAFHIAHLEQAVADARAKLAAARVAVLPVRGKMAKLEARRAVRVAAMALSDAQAALTKEKSDEQFAASVQRKGIVQKGVLVLEKQADGTRQAVRRDVTLREPRIDMNGKRPDLQPALERLRARDAISVRCYRAGCRYRTAWEKAGRDAFPIGMSGEGGGGMPSSGNRRIEEAVGCGADLAAARAAVGVFGTSMLEHIIVAGLTISAWSAMQGESEHVAKGILIMVLERLAEHWAERDAPAKAGISAADDARTRIRSLHGSV